MSKARRAAPRYVDANPSSAHAKIESRNGARAGESRRTHQRHELVGHERTVEDRVLALGCAHPERVPRLDDLDTVGVARQEPVHDLRMLGIRRVHRVETAVGPHRREAAEVLVAGDLPAAITAFGRRDREQQRQVVPRFAVQRAEHLAFGRLLEDPPARLVTRAQQVGGDTRPVAVHVDRERGGRRDVREAPLEPRVLVETEPRASELRRHRREQVARPLELVEVFDEESVLPVVQGRPLVEASQHLVGQQVFRSSLHAAAPFGRGHPSRITMGSSRIVRHPVWRRFGAGRRPVRSCRRHDFETQRPAGSKPLVSPGNGVLPSGSGRLAMPCTRLAAGTDQSDQSPHAL